MALLPYQQASRAPRNPDRFVTQILREPNGKELNRFVTMIFAFGALLLSE